MGSLYVRLWHRMTRYQAFSYRTTQEPLTARYSSNHWKVLYSMVIVKRSPLLEWIKTDGNINLFYRYGWLSLCLSFNIWKYYCKPTFISVIKMFMFTRALSMQIFLTANQSSSVSCIISLQIIYILIMIIVTVNQLISS